MQEQWADENPYFLLIVKDDDGEGEERPHARIDLGETGWSQTYADWMRVPGFWYLCHKYSEQIALALRVNDGEQPYYTKRHVGQLDFAHGQARETACHGIGKKRLDGHVDRLWILPDGYAVCAGDDVNPLAMEVVKTLAWQQLPPDDGEGPPQQ